MFGEREGSSRQTRKVIEGFCLYSKVNRISKDQGVVGKDMNRMGESHVSLYFFKIYLNF